MSTPLTQGTDHPRPWGAMSFQRGSKTRRWMREECLYAACKERGRHLLPKPTSGSPNHTVQNLKGQPCQARGLCLTHTPATLPPPAPDAPVPSHREHTKGLGGARLSSPHTTHFLSLPVQPPVHVSHHGPPHPTGPSWCPTQASLT